ncbi:phosphoribosylformylglycinamidine synthase subunit PurQ [Neomegalonema perideroedes]|uniref:phosphoribosylformylglycinamidine synthase subunit PurQ n=1 Tax=Neomegalonema perideroedes TaxID=217219 RepID=UPI00035D279D|nr:phosphoribosylformylglycinamidine synthase subunit PurQ [Neomegalonema perideroedes]
MKSAVLVFPGSNCDRDMAVALERVSGRKPKMVWHKEAELPLGVDLAVVPGGFSFGDYLRSGAIAARSPAMRAVADFAARGGMVLGVCNGFQVLTEAGLLPGALMRNAGLDFLCKPVELIVEETQSPFGRGYEAGARIRLPIAHHDGRYVAEAETLDRLEGESRVAFRYAEEVNGSERRIAGILSENRRVLGMMPHPERAIEAILGGVDGLPMFETLTQEAA